MELDELKAQLDNVEGAQAEEAQDQLLDKFVSKFGNRFDNNASIGELLMRQLRMNGVDVSLLDQSVEQGIEQIAAQLTAEAQSIIDLFNTGKQAAMELEQKTEGIKNALESAITQQNAAAGELPPEQADEIATNMPDPGMDDGSVMGDEGMPPVEEQMPMDPNAMPPEQQMPMDPNAMPPEQQMPMDPNAMPPMNNGMAVSDRNKKILLAAKYAVSDRRKKQVIAPANNNTKLNTSFITACNGGY